jgi:hypothetical protein
VSPQPSVGDQFHITSVNCLLQFNRSLLVAYVYPSVLFFLSFIPFSLLLYSWLGSGLNCNIKLCTSSPYMVQFWTYSCDRCLVWEKYMFPHSLNQSDIANVISNELSHPYMCTCICLYRVCLGIPSLLFLGFVIKIMYSHIISPMHGTWATCLNNGKISFMNCAFRWGECQTSEAHGPKSLNVKENL